MARSARAASARSCRRLAVATVATLALVALGGLGPAGLWAGVLWSAPAAAATAANASNMAVAHRADSTAAVRAAGALDLAGHRRAAAPPGAPHSLVAVPATRLAVTPPPARARVGPRAAAIPAAGPAVTQVARAPPASAGT